MTAKPPGASGMASPLPGTASLQGLPGPRSEDCQFPFPRYQHFSQVSHLPYLVPPSPWTSGCQPQLPIAVTGEALTKCFPLGPPPRDSHFIDLGEGIEITIFKKQPRGSEAQPRKRVTVTSPVTHDAARESRPAARGHPPALNSPREHVTRQLSGPRP